MPSSDVGSDGNPGGPAFVAGEGTPHALIIVPIGKHTGSSDGSSRGASGSR